MDILLLNNNTSFMSYFISNTFWAGINKKRKFSPFYYDLYLLSRAMAIFWSRSLGYFGYCIIIKQYIGICRQSNISIGVSMVPSNSIIAPSPPMLPWLPRPPAAICLAISALIMALFAAPPDPAEPTWPYTLPTNRHKKQIAEATFILNNLNNKNFVPQKKTLEFTQTWICLITKKRVWS